MENLERICTVAKGAEAFELATVLLEYNQKKKRRFVFVKINGHIMSIIYSKYYTNCSFTRPRTINRGHTVTSTVTDCKEKMFYITF